MVCTMFWVDLDILFLETMLGADKISGYIWQLVTAVYDGGDGLTLCEQFS